MGIQESLQGHILKIDHVGFAVADLDAAVNLWARLGFAKIHEEINEPQGVREAMLKVGQSEQCLQLLAPLSPDSTIARYLEKSGPGIQQIAFTVSDVQAASAAARAAGFRVLYDRPAHGTSGSLINFIHPKDTGGVLVELVEPLVGNHP